MGRLQSTNFLPISFENAIGSSWLLTVLVIYAINITPTDQTVDKEMQLQLVQVLFRHGARNVIETYPNDPYKDESFWPEGFAQLTKVGKQQHYALGKYLRVRYHNFLNASYSPYEIHVQASDVDRTLMSAEVDLAGLYPPNPGDPSSVWNEKVLWQPIPVHTMPKEMDNKLRMSAPCPRLQKLIDVFNNGTEMAAIYAENQELFEYLKTNSGKPRMQTLQDLDYLYDALFIENLRNYTLPDWTKKVFPGGQFLNLTAMSFKVLTWNEEMKRLKAGPLVQEIVQHFHDKANGSENLDHRLKMFMYSGHDTTIASLLNALDLFNNIPPPYASAVIMELYKNVSNNADFVKIFYRNDSQHDPYLLEIPGCQSSCPMEMLIKLTKHLIPENWESECQYGFLGLEGLSLAALFLGTFLSILLLVSMLVVAFSRRNKKNNPVYPYLHLQMEDEEA